MPEIYPWTILEMPGEGADERSVRCAYAQKLKKCRPDDDPEAFQILLQARNHALSELKERAFLDNDACLQVGLEDGLLTKGSDEILGQEGSADDLLFEDETEPDISTVQAIADEQFSHRYFEEKLEEMNDPSLDIWELPYWHDFFEALNNASFHCRQDIEWLLIRQLGIRLFETAQFGDGYVGSKKLTQENAQNVLSLLDEEFGWTDNDQKVYKVLGHNDGDLFLYLIRSAAAQNLDTRREIKTSDSTIPYISISDLRALTGDNGEDVVQYYIAARQSGKGLVRIPFWLYLAGLACIMESKSEHYCFAGYYHCCVAIGSSVSAFSIWPVRRTSRRIAPIIHCPLR